MTILLLYDAADDSAKCYDLAIAVSREICIRNHSIQPRIGDKREQRWADEGHRERSELDTVRENPRG